MGEKDRMKHTAIGMQQTIITTANGEHVHCLVRDYCEQKKIMEMPTDKRQKCLFCRDEPAVMMVDARMGSSVTVIWSRTSTHGRAGHSQRPQAQLTLAEHAGATEIEFARGTAIRLERLSREDE